MAEKAQGLAAEILDADDKDLVEYPVAEWGGKMIWLRAFSGTERNAIIKLSAQEDGQRTQAAVLRYGIADQSGKAVFTDKTVQDLMAKANGIVLEEIAKAVLRHNKLLKEDVDTAKKE